MGYNSIADIMALSSFV